MQRRYMFDVWGNRLTISRAGNGTWHITDTNGDWIGYVKPVAVIFGEKWAVHWGDCSRPRFTDGTRPVKPPVYGRTISEATGLNCFW